MAAHPFGWLDILLHAHTLRASNNPTPEERLDYFALCLACHHGTVATFIPTDVDSKIRGVLWQAREEPAQYRRMLDLTLHAMKWDVSKISTRATQLSGVGPVSGHNGEMLGVLGGALGCFVKHDDAECAEKAAAAIDAEFAREAHEFRHVLEMKDREIDLLRLSSSLTHNCGDMDQGISFWSQHEKYAPYRVRFGRLAHENTGPVVQPSWLHVQAGRLHHENSAPYGGTFQIAAHLYKRILSSEGHRHYPLREVRALRSSPDFLLPLGPFFDEWGEIVGAHPALKIEERAEVLAALLSGCKKIANQLGYFRAVSGMARALGGNLDAASKRMPAALRLELKDAEVKRHIALKQISFESSMRKKAQAALAEIGR
ncbi:MAG TPA: hypothetical protein VKX17_17060 [Planctomycetota bacterium]|nr:hypothetical protein [Planctomycetota bacterium]